MTCICDFFSSLCATPTPVDKTASAAQGKGQPTGIALPEQPTASRENTVEPTQKVRWYSRVEKMGITRYRQGEFVEQSDALAYMNLIQRIAGPLFAKPSALTIVFDDQFSVIALTKTDCFNATRWTVRGVIGEPIANITSINTIKQLHETIRKQEGVFSKVEKISVRMKQGNKTEEQKEFAAHVFLVKQGDYFVALLFRVNEQALSIFGEELQKMGQVFLQPRSATPQSMSYHYVDQYFMKSEFWTWSKKDFESDSTFIDFLFIQQQNKLLSDSRQELQKVNIPGLMMLICTKDWKILAMTNNVEKELSYEPSEFLNHRLTEFISDLSGASSAAIPHTLFDFSEATTGSVGVGTAAAAAGAGSGCGSGAMTAATEAAPQNPIGNASSPSGVSLAATTFSGISPSTILHVTEGMNSARFPAAGILTPTPFSPAAAAYHLGGMNPAGVQSAAVPAAAAVPQLKPIESPHKSDGPLHLYPPPVLALDEDELDQVHSPTQRLRRIAVASPNNQRQFKQVMMHHSLLQSHLIQVTLIPIKGTNSTPPSPVMVAMPATIISVRAGGGSSPHLLPTPAPPNKVSPRRLSPRKQPPMAVIEEKPNEGVATGNTEGKDKKKDG